MITFGFRNKFSGVARASIAIILGLIMIIWRGSILPLIVKVIAAVMIASGIVSLAYGIINRNNGALGLSVFNTVVDIVIGILLFIYPNQVADFVVILIGIALTVFGIFQVIALVSTSALLHVGFLALFLPVICAVGGLLLIGLLFIGDPSQATATLTMIAGIAVVIYGLSELMTSWKMSKAIHEYEIKFPSSDKEKEKTGAFDYDDVKDAEFEKAGKDKE